MKRTAIARVSQKRRDKGDLLPNSTFARPERGARQPRPIASSLPRPSKTLPKKSIEGGRDRAEPRRNSLPRGKPIGKRRRSKADTERVYGPKAFRDYLHAHPCLWCGRQGVEAAHLRGNGGVGRKADFTTTGPLCGPAVLGHCVTGPARYPGCHSRFDRACEERLWFTDAQRTSILLRLDAFHERWSHLADKEGR